MGVTFPISVINHHYSLFLLPQLPFDLQPLTPSSPFCHLRPSGQRLLLPPSSLPSSVDGAAERKPHYHRRCCEISVAVWLRQDPFAQQLRSLMIDYRPLIVITWFLRFGKSPLRFLLSTLMSLSFVILRSHSRDLHFVYSLECVLTSSLLVEVEVDL